MPGIRMQLVSLLVLELNQSKASRRERSTNLGLKRADMAGRQLEDETEDETEDEMGDEKGYPHGRLNILSPPGSS
jgi:hypothetical protein